MAENTAESSGTELFFQRKDKSQESGEAEKLDTSEEEGSEQEEEESDDEEEGEAEEGEESDEEEDDEEDEEDDEDNSDSNSKTSKGYKAKFEKAETQRKEWQSRYDRQATQINQLESEINQVKEKQDGKEIDDIFEGKDPDDVITIAEVQKLIPKITPKKAKPIKDSDVAWVERQADVAEVDAFYRAVKEQFDPLIKSEKMSAREAYLTLRSMMHEDDAAVQKKENAALAKKNAKIKKKKSRSKTPISGPGSGSSSGTRSTGKRPHIDPFFQKPWNK